MTAFLVAIGMAVGLVGVLVPVIPGLSLIWLCGLVYGLVGNFGTAGTVAFSIMTVLAIIGMAAQYVLPGKAASGAGASTTSLFMGAILGIVGFFVIPILGLPIGAVGGIFLGEYLRTSNLDLSREATWATLKGFGVGVLAQLVCGFAMILAWIGWVLA